MEPIDVDKLKKEGKKVMTIDIEPKWVDLMDIVIDRTDDQHIKNLLKEFKGPLEISDLVRQAQKHKKGSIKFTFKEGSNDVDVEYGDGTREP